MGRKSKVTDLHPQLREAVDALVRQGKTIKDIVQHLQVLAAQVDPDADLPSESSIGRYKQKAEKTMERYREAQAVAGVWIERLDAEPGSDVGRLLTEMLRTVAFQVLGEMGEGGVATADEVMLLAKAMKDLSTADATVVRREQLRRQLQADMAKKTEAAAAEMEDFARSRGLTDEDWALIRAKFLGVSTDA